MFNFVVAIFNQISPEGAILIFGMMGSCVAGTTVAVGNDVDATEGSSADYVIGMG